MPRSAPARGLDWLFRDRRSGRIVIGQWPNLAISVFAVAAAGAWLVDLVAPGASQLGVGLRLAAGLGLAWWSIDEMARGVNPWRRCLGTVALCYLVWRGWQGL